MKRNFICILITIGFVLTACGDFLKEYSQDLVYATSTSDLSELLVGEGYASTDGKVGRDFNFYAIHLMDDDIIESIVDGGYSNRVDDGFYCFKEQPFELYEQPIEDDIWRDVYKKIGALNTIIAEAENFKGDDGYDRVQ